MKPSAWASRQAWRSSSSVALALPQRRFSLMVPENSTFCWSTTALHHPHEADGPLVVVIGGVKDQGLQGRVVISLGPSQGPAAQPACRAASRPTVKIKNAAVSPSICLPRAFMLRGPALFADSPGPVPPQGKRPRSGGRRPGASMKKPYWRGGNRPWR